ncbi:NCS2 family permease [Tuberibacillus sp. Marseille-P3662]|uniref:NCS2 family permease n=1 Tax=Tuberibacillus sp. Marseille-P3662 TaxID=1965358 RepID=UPI000A1CDAFC|nr:NCS2 family permease [Tuberibacillus sp. Marseille-P3662]
MGFSQKVAQYFGFDEQQTNYKQESVAGLTTFFAMAYILFVNPSVLANAGMDQKAVFVATALAAALGTLLMGVLAKYPIAVAPGMGINAFFAFSVVVGRGIPWQTALSGVFIAGLLFVLITVFRIREKIINAIPLNLKYAISGGIGLFIAFIGLQNAKMVVPDESTLVTFGDITAPGVLLTSFGLVVTIVLMTLNIKAGIFYGMVATAVVGMITGVVPVPGDIVSAVPSMEPTFLAAFEGFSDIQITELVTVIITFLLVAFFDTAGTLMAVANIGGFLKGNRLPRAGRAMLADSISMVAGSLFGTSPTSAYIESSSGVAAGGRTGFASVITAVLLLLALFFSPLLSVVTNEVTAPALIVVGALMASSIGKIEWDHFEIAIPAFLILVAIPLTYSITTGLALGFIAYPITMIVKGRYKELHPIMYGLFIIFIICLPYLSV